MAHPAPQRVVAANDFAAAWGENRILETFFAPVLDTPSYAAPAVSRWPPLATLARSAEVAAQREDAEKRRPAENTEYVSHAEPYPLFPWPRGAFWLAAIACALAPGAAGLAWDRRRVAFGGPERPALRMSFPR